MSESSTKPVVDLLSGDSSSEVVAAVVSSAASSAADPAKDDEVYNKLELEGNYSDNDDDDVSVEEDDDQEADGRISALASRTNHLIDSYRDFIAEMSHDPIVGGDADDAAAAADIAATVMMESGGGKPTTITTIAEKVNDIPPPSSSTEATKKGFLEHFQDVRKGATLYNDYSFKDDDPTPHHPNNNNVNLHSLRYGNDDHSFSTYDDDGDDDFGRRKRRYHYAMFRSAPFRRRCVVIGLVAIGTIVGLSVGITKTLQRKQDLSNNWEGMLAESSEEEQQQGGPTIYQPVLPLEPNNNNPSTITITTTPNNNSNSQEESINPQEISEMYQYSAMKYHLNWFSREDGWTGQTYDAAMSYCAAQEGGLVICKYEAICPAGANKMPMGGTNIGAEPTGSTWAPIMDKENSWTQVGMSDNWCEILEEAPEWGLTGMDDEGITRYVACCRVTTDDDDDDNDGTTTTTTADSSNVAEEDEEEEPVADTITPFEDEYSMIAQVFNPIWYNRESGWNGRTYQESLNFCKAQGPNVMLCPMEALCPGGVGKRPYPGPQMLESESWAAFADKANGWVHVGGEKSSALDCIPYESMHPNPPDWGETGLNNEEITRHILCCNELGGVEETVVSGQPQPETQPQPEPQPEPQQPSPTTPPAMDSNLSVEEYNLLVATGTKFKVNRYDRNSGWGGSSYYEALMFCGAKGATVCPYEGWCPQGPSKAVVGGMATSSQWVPFINVANGWIQIGPDDTCMPYNSINTLPPEWGLTGENKAETSLIMCCEPDDNWIPEDQTAAVVVSSAPSQVDKLAMDMFKPIWFGRKHGWQGGSHQDAEQFCNNIGDMELCPIMALCPDGKTLFNDMLPFPGEQWSPLSDGDWALTGSIEADPTATCKEYGDLTQQPSTDMDEVSEDKKQHIMCCAKSSDEEDLEKIIKATMQPTWHDSTDGWSGGSHSDAVNFCKKSGGGRELCPFVAYCPHGEGYQPFPGHPVDFNTETVQWSPWGEGTGKGWVLVSQKYQNSATTCMTYRDLEGGIPPWDENSDLAEAKKYVLCCNPSEPPTNPSTPMTQSSPSPPTPTSQQPTELPTKPPSPGPTSPPTPQPTLPPQDVKWYPLESDGEKTCVQGSGYDPHYLDKGWTYETETDCCKAYLLPCGEKDVMWYPTSSSGEKQCVEGTDYPWSFLTTGWLHSTKQECCVSIQLDCSPKPQKWKPTLVAGEKACVFMEVEESDHQFDSEGECCAAFPLACPTTTTTTTTTTTAATTPPCQPSGGKGCHWWPKLDVEATKIVCIYSSDWPEQASDVLFGDYESCYCNFNAC